MEIDGKTNEESKCRASLRRGANTTLSSKLQISFQKLQLFECFEMVINEQIKSIILSIQQRYINPT